MTTLTFDRTSTARHLPTWRETLRWTRETPAPRWGDQVPGARTRATVYLAASMTLWTAAGLGGAALLARVIELIPPVL